MPSLSVPEPELADAFAAAAAGWGPLTRSGDRLAFALPGRYVMPGGFFKWFFYWDSCFVVPGLLVSGKQTLAREIVDNLVASIEEYGFVPNYDGPKGVCASRSQPPFLTWMIGELWPTIGESAWLERAVAAATTEYETYWTAEPHLTELGLSRYIDLGGEGCETVPDSPHHRAVAESGWDNTTRFGEDATRVVPVDLNAQLHRYETDLAGFYRILDRPREAAVWERRAGDRGELIDRWHWDDRLGIYRDLDLETLRPTEGVPLTLASYVPLWSGSASAEQARRSVAHLHRFEADHGVAASEADTNDVDAHDWPTGWAYSHWYVCDGLARYGHRPDAVRIALKWLRRVADERAVSGRFLERYNVVDSDGPTPGRYRPQPGFGWTNAVFLLLVARTLFDELGRPRDALPPSWRDARLVADDDVTDGPQTPPERS
jgi:alpha,alpha-trehalase